MTKPERSQRLKFCPSLKPLPDDFAEQVLNLEMEVEVGQSLESLKKLLVLYSQAVEFFEVKRDKKFQYYKDRMVSMLKKQDALLSSDSISKNSERSSSLQNNREADRAIKSHIEMNARVSRRARQNIDSQQSSLHRRLSARRFSSIGENPDNTESRRNSGKMRNSLDMTPKGRKQFFRFSCEGESDRSGGPSNDKEYENIVEKFLIEKLQRIHDVKNRYKHAKKDLEDMSDDSVVRQIVEEMDRRMDKEIKEIEEDIERRKREDVMILKGQNFDSVDN